MEKITFNVIRMGKDYCRIVCNDIRNYFKETADGGIILSLDVMLDEMECIKKAVKERYKKEAVFQIVSQEAGR
jgi:hypothetical protein